MPYHSRRFTSRKFNHDVAYAFNGAVYCGQFTHQNRLCGLFSPHARLFPCTRKKGAKPMSEHGFKSPSAVYGEGDLGGEVGPNSLSPLYAARMELINCTQEHVPVIGEKQVNNLLNLCPPLSLNRRNPPQIQLFREVTRRNVILANPPQFGGFRLAAVFRKPAAWVEVTALRRVRRVRHITL